MSWTLRERAAATPCPAHGHRCRLAGHRGLVFTFMCGLAFHADESRVRRVTPLPPARVDLEET